MGFPKGASIPFGQGRGQYPGREVASFIVEEVTFAAADRRLLRAAAAEELKVVNVETQQIS